MTALSDIRKAAGLTSRQAAANLAIALGVPSRSHVSILKIEKYGTKKYDVMIALASIYKVPFETIRQAIKPAENLVH